MTLPTARFLYLYDKLNRRVKEDLDSSTDVVYLYDGWQAPLTRSGLGVPGITRERFN